MKTIIIGSDHRGLVLKQDLVNFLEKLNYKVIDVGPYEYVSDDDYPIFAEQVAAKINAEDTLGVIICGSGVGVSIASNKVAGIRCGLCTQITQATHARQYDHINILALSSEYVDAPTNKAITQAFLNAFPSDEARVIRRIHQIKSLEEN
jgi:ribose 5-phosphate isomerase B